MKTKSLLAVLLLVLPLAARAGTTTSDPKAVAIADEVMKALGGRERWDALAGLRWSFEVAVNDTVRSSRRHAWDRRSGWHRVEGRTRAGLPFVFIHRVGGSDGKAWMDGTPIAGDSLKKLITRAQSLWVNDTYWMLMPYKLSDPGVTLKDAGDTTLAGTTCDRIALSFDQVGETPGDRYWVYVNRVSHRVERWDMVLQGDQPPPRTYTWEGWEEHGGLWFPTAHRQGNAVVYTRRVETVEKFPATEFSAP